MMFNNAFLIGYKYTCIVCFSTSCPRSTKRYVAIALLAFIEKLFKQAS